MPSYNVKTLCRKAFRPSLVLLLAACEPGGEAFVEHPIRDSLSIDPDEAVVVVREDEPIPSARLFVSRIRDREPIASIGERGGDREQWFGSIDDAIFMRGGELAVLDRLEALVRVYDEEGAYLYSVGGEGEGPGEFDVPVALVSPEPGSLWVMDGARAIHRHEEESGQMAFQDRLEPAGFVRDACATQGTVVVHTPSYVPGEGFDEVLVAVDADGQELDRFAVPYRYGADPRTRITTARMKRGSVACVGDGRVLLAFEAQNRLDAYDTDTGDLLWHATFEGVRIPRVLEGRTSDGRERVRVDLEEHPYHHILLGIAAGPEGGSPVVVQYGRRELEDIRNRVDRHTVETYVVDPSTGEGAFVGDDIPRILVMESDHAVLLSDEPYPRIEIVQLGPREEAGS